VVLTDPSDFKLLRDSVPVAFLVFCYPQVVSREEREKYEKAGIWQVKGTPDKNDTNQRPVPGTFMNVSYLWQISDDGTTSGDELWEQLKSNLERPRDHERIINLVVERRSLIPALGIDAEAASTQFYNAVGGHAPDPIEESAEIRALEMRANITLDGTEFKAIMDKIGELRAAEAQVNPTVDAYGVVSRHWAGKQRFEMTTFLGLGFMAIKDRLRAQDPGTRNFANLVTGKHDLLAFSLFKVVEGRTKDVDVFEVQKAKNRNMPSSVQGGLVTGSATQTTSGRPDYSQARAAQDAAFDKKPKGKK
jgi:hypothetical protein